MTTTMVDRWSVDIIEFDPRVATSTKGVENTRSNTMEWGVHARPVWVSTGGQLMLWTNLWFAAGTKH
jgi:hypothetical protein